MSRVAPPSYGGAFNSACSACAQIVNLLSLPHTLLSCGPHEPMLDSYHARDTSASATFQSRNGELILLLPAKLTLRRSIPPTPTSVCRLMHSPGAQVQPVKAGEEIFSSFGSISNAQLLNSYGFVLPG